MMDLQILLLLWSAIGVIVGFIAGKTLGPRRRSGYLPYLFGGAVGANVAGFIVRSAFGFERQSFGNFGSLVVAIVGAALFIALAHLLPVRQTLKH